MPIAFVGASSPIRFFIFRMELQPIRLNNEIWILFKVIGRWIDFVIKLLKQAGDVSGEGANQVKNPGSESRLYFALEKGHGLNCIKGVRSQKENEVAALEPFTIRTEPKAKSPSEFLDSGS